jgi:trans-2,3-dihydro-3-hydroxyanthranilate isomerase
MQSIAKEFNLSETTFVLPPEDKGNNYRVRIFTPAIELPMAGHPTIGTTYVLARERMVEQSLSGITTVNLEEGVGTIPVRIEWQDGAAAFIEMSQPLPTFSARFEDVDLIAEILSLDPQAITDTGLPIEVGSCGVPFLFIPLRDLKAVRGIRLRLDLWEGKLKGTKAQNMFVFTKETEIAGSTVHSRMFAPGSGILEDPATGSASGPLGAYLVRHKVFPSVSEFVSEQGLELGRASFIKIRIDQNTRGEISGVYVGGQCHFMGEGQLQIDRAQD